jgi:serine/threonine protein kinase/tetratricopeptide (TPR) repeat protein
MRAEHWDVLSGWLTAWLEADAPGRARLREQLRADHAHLVDDAERYIASLESMTGFLETPAIVMEARELALDDPILPSGALVGPYRVGGLLARGGMGDVYRATDTRLRRDVALKVLAQTKTTDPLRVERFMQEARVTAALDHPNIVRVYDVGRYEDRAYLVAELLQGETLRARIARGPIPPDEARRLALEIARGLAAAHAAGLVHRDLKPENVFLTRDGHAKLLDFGIAKLTQDENVPDGFSTLTGVVLGTAGYLAPEQIRGEKIDSRADLFAFGAVLFEMLTGTRAFAREQIVDTLHAILHHPPALSLDERPDVPPAIATVVSRLLQKAPAARVQSATDLITELERANLDAARTWRERAALRWRTATRHPWRVGVAAALTLAIVALSTWLLWPSPPHGITLVVLPFRSLPGGDQTFDRGIAETFIQRLSQLPDVTVPPLVATEPHRNKDPRTVGRELGATHVLWGTIQRDGNRISANARLERMDESNPDVIAVPDTLSLFNLYEITASRVIESLAPDLEAAHRARLAQAGTLDSQAYDHYVRARGLVTQPDPQSLQQAVALFREVIGLDRSYADAYAGLGSALKRLTVVADRDPIEVFKEARLAAGQALQLQPNHPEALSVLGTVAFWHDWDYPKAKELLTAAKALQPSEPDHPLFLAHVHSNIGEENQALSEISRARSKAPGWPLPRALEGEFLMHGGRFQEAVDHLDQLIEIEPTFWLARLFRAFALPTAKRYLEMVTECDTIIRLRQEKAPKPIPPYSYAVALKGYAFAKLNRPDDAREMLKELYAQAEHGYLPASRIALVHYALGDEDNAIAQLEKAVDQKDVLLTFLGVSPLWDEWRDKPRFQQILDKVHLLGVSKAVSASGRR